ncbi:hypothetical protein [Morganella morganii]|uniref:hypothetical protein n=1 Tax=Morganella morganii TaxID=582 RepID=UPI001E62E7B3|nr:hypothetical protein [Morganella morganii]
MKVKVEHNGKTIWCRDSESGTGMTSRGYLTDGTQQKIVTALINALTQANGEISLQPPLQQINLTVSDEQIKKVAEELRGVMTAKTTLSLSSGIEIDCPEIKITGSITPFR